LRTLCDYLGGDVAARASREVGRFQIREEQRELQGPKEIVTSAKLKFTKTADADLWKLIVELFAKYSIVVEHHALYQDAGWLCRTGHVHWVPMPSLGLGWGFSELDHKTWEKPDDGWKVWDPHISNLEAGLPAADLGANARATGEMLTAEQSSNKQRQRRCGKHYSSPCRIKKATARGPFQGATEGCTRAIHGASRDPGD
jgi:hypothetical protein